MRYLAALLLVISPAACDRDTARAGASADAAGSAGSAGARADSTAEATPARTLQAMPMLPGFRAELDSIATTPAMLKSSMSAHMTAMHRVMDAMHADMMAVGMHSDAAYEALSDSVVKGSAALATAKDHDLARLVMVHVDQLRRLTAVYEEKTASM